MAIEVKLTPRLSSNSKEVKSTKMLFEAGNGHIHPKRFAIEQYLLVPTYLHWLCLFILLIMRLLAIKSPKSLILTGGQCLTAYGSHVSKITPDWIHAHKRTNLLTLAYIMINKDQV